MLLGEAEDDEKALNAHLEDRLANECCSEKHLEWDEEVTTSQPRQIKQRIGNLYRQIS